jgi:hypothetical protein
MATTTKTVWLDCNPSALGLVPTATPVPETVTGFPVSAPTRTVPHCPAALIAEASPVCPLSQHLQHPPTEGLGFTVAIEVQGKRFGAIGGPIQVDMQQDILFFPSEGQEEPEPPENQNHHKHGVRSNCGLGNISGSQQRCSLRRS